MQDGWGGDIPKKGLDVICPLQPIINHPGMLKDIQYQEGRASYRVAPIVLIDPKVDELSCRLILVYEPMLRSLVL